MDLIKLENNKLPELQAFAKDIGCKKISTLKKKDLIEVITKKLQEESARLDKENTVNEPEELNVTETAEESDTDKKDISKDISSDSNESDKKPNENIKTAYQKTRRKNTYSNNKYSNYNNRNKTRKNDYRKDDSNNDIDNAELEKQIEYAKKHYNTSNPAIPELLVGDCGEARGVLEIISDGYGFLRSENYSSGPNDVYISQSQIRRFSLKTGDLVTGKTRKAREGEKYPALLYVDSINDEDPSNAIKRTPFEKMIPIYPEERITLENENTPKDLATRIIDLVSPIGKGQRGLIVSPPKAGKTTLLQKIAHSIKKNYPDTYLIVLLVDERPEEVTEMKESIDGDVVFSTFDELPTNHTKVAEMTLQRGMRLVEQGKDVVILLDSITRLARAYNLTIPSTGRSLSGGLDPGALHKPKRFFGAARNIRNGSSLTVIATALVDTGSRMDEVIYEEFKGTGNMEVHLDRKLSEKRIFPAVDLNKSSTRREEKLLTKKELDAVWLLRKNLSDVSSDKTMEIIMNDLASTNTNDEFIDKMVGHFESNENSMNDLKNDNYVVFR